MDAFAVTVVRNDVPVSNCRNCTSAVFQSNGEDICRSPPQDRPSTRARYLETYDGLRAGIVDCKLSCRQCEPDVPPGCRRRYLLWEGVLVKVLNRLLHIGDPPRQRVTKASTGKKSMGMFHACFAAVSCVSELPTFVVVIQSLTEMLGRAPGLSGSLQGVRTRPSGSLSISSRAGDNCRSLQVGSERRGVFLGRPHPAVARGIGIMLGVMEMARAPMRLCH
jgi:hypothetical protein